MCGQMKKRIAVIAVVILTIIFLLACIVGITLDRNKWKKRTTPLPSDTVVILCTNFKLEEDHRLCSGKRDIYGPDFYKIIRETFRPYEEYNIDKNIDTNEAATYDEVENVIGMFKYECESVVYQADGFNSYVCRYDLRGDGEFTIGILFTYPDNVVYGIYTPMGYDGE